MVTLGQVALEDGPSGLPTESRLTRTRLQQEWLNRRLEGLEPADFEVDIRIFCMADVEPVPGFEHKWQAFSHAGGDDAARGGPSVHSRVEAEIEDCVVVLVFCDLNVEEEMRALRNLIDHIATEHANSGELPCMVWIPHSVAPERRDPATGNNASIARTMMLELLELGICSVISGEPAGFDLALAVRSALHLLMPHAMAICNSADAQLMTAYSASHLKTEIQHIIWGYFRVRLSTSLPEVDTSLPDSMQPQLPGYAVQRRLRGGMGAHVYSVISEEGDLQNVKVTRKKDLSDVRELYHIQNMITVHEQLSSEQYQHPNIAKLHQVYQSLTHVYFRTEFTGNVNLFQRLLARQQQGADPVCPLNVSQATSIIEQAVDVVTHMHLGPRVVHRDIKPENFGVFEDEEGRMKIVLSSCEVAVVKSGDTYCQSRIGTLPFMAPEIIEKPRYCGFKADIWSVGVLIFEMLCGAHSFDRALQLQLDRSDMSEERVNKAFSMIRPALAEPGAVLRLFEEHCFQELRPLLSGVRPMVDGALQLDVPSRLDDLGLLQRLHSGFSAA